MTKRIGLDLTDDLHAWIKAKAERDRRSIQQEILWLLERLQANDKGDSHAPPSEH